MAGEMAVEKRQKSRIVHRGHVTKLEGSKNDLLKDPNPKDLFIYLFFL